jgi:hypothetical protein
MNIKEQIEKIELKTVLILNKDKLKKINKNPIYSKHFRKHYQEYSNHYYKNDLEYFNFTINRTKNTESKLNAVIMYILTNAMLLDYIKNNLYLILIIIKIIINNNKNITKDKTKKIINQLANNIDIYDVLKNNFSLQELLLVKEL